MKFLPLHSKKTVFGLKHTELVFGKKHNRGINLAFALLPKVLEDKV